MRHDGSGNPCLISPLSRIMVRCPRSGEVMLYLSGMLGYGTTTNCSTPSCNASEANDWRDEADLRSTGMDAAWVGILQKHAQ